MNIYLIWCRNDDMEDILVGATDTMNEANSMKEELESVFGDVFEYTIQSWAKNQVVIDDVPYRY